MPATLEEATAIAEQLTPSEKVRLVKYLAQSLENASSQENKPKDLRGIWEGRFSEDFDVENEIKEIREEWKKKFSDL